jgi:hypothetical protein
VHCFAIILDIFHFLKCTPCANQIGLGGTWVKSATAKEISLLLISIAFLPVDGIRYDLPMYRGNNGLSYDILTMVFVGYLRKILWVFLSSTLAISTLGIFSRWFCCAFWQSEGYLLYMVYTLSEVCFIHDVLGVISARIFR